MSDEEKSKKRESSSSESSSSSDESDQEIVQGELFNNEKACTVVSPVPSIGRLHTPNTNIPLSPYPSPLPSSATYPVTPYPTTPYPATPYPPACYPATPYPKNYPSSQLPTTADSYPSTSYPSSSYPSPDYPSVSALPSGYPELNYPANKHKEEDKPEPEPEKEESAEPEPDHDKHDGGDDGKKHKVEDIDDGMAKMMKYGTAEVFKGTIHRNEDFNVESAAETLKEAMAGLGTDEQPIIDIASNASNTQREELVKVYKTMYGEDLIEQLLSELTGNFEDAILALFHPKIYYDAWTLNKAMSGPGTKDMVLIEVLCTRTNTEIREIVESYEKHFGRTLEQDILDDTSGYFKRLLVSCLQANRDELSVDEMERVLSDGPGCVIDEGRAREEAEKLYQAGEGKIGTEEDAFLQVMSLRHYYQLRATFDEYKEVSGKDILEAVVGEFTGDEEDGFKALVMCARNRPEYFADRLYNSMKGAGTDDSTLVRVVASRSEIDLQNIKDVFEKKYGKSLLLFIEEDTSGDYKRLLSAIVGS